MIVSERDFIVERVDMLLIRDVATKYQVTTVIKKDMRLKNIPTRAALKD